MIFQTFLVTIPAMLNVAILLSLLLYIYSVTGMQLFAHVKYNGPYQLDGKINFSNIQYSMLTMFRVATGENWHEVMFALSRKKSPLYQCIE